jgi:hypothetical protein
MDDAFSHRGYLANCSPARKVDGTYQPYVVIARCSDGELVVNRFLPPAVRCPTKDAAIEHARQWATDWINRSGEGLPGD